MGLGLAGKAARDWEAIYVTVVHTSFVGQP